MWLFPCYSVSEPQINKEFVIVALKHKHIWFVLGSLDIATLIFLCMYCSTCMMRYGMPYGLAECSFFWDQNFNYTHCFLNNFIPTSYLYKIASMYRAHFSQFKLNFHFNFHQTRGVMVYIGWELLVGEAGHVQLCCV